MLPSSKSDGGGQNSDQRVCDLDTFERLAYFHRVNNNMSQAATGTMNSRMTSERAQTRVLVVDDEEASAPRWRR